jgi:hypothetical protein
MDVARSASGVARREWTDNVDGGRCSVTDSEYHSSPVPDTDDVTVRLGAE